MKKIKDWLGLALATILFFFMRKEKHEKAPHDRSSTPYKLDTALRTDNPSDFPCHQEKGEEGQGEV